MVVVCKFCHVEQVCPVILLVVTEHVNVGLNPFVVVVDLSLCLGMIGGQESLINMQCFEEAVSVFSGEE